MTKNLLNIDPGSVLNGRVKILTYTDKQESTLIEFKERSIYGFYSKTAPFFDFMLSSRFLHFYTVEYLYFMNERLKFRDIPNDVTMTSWCGPFWAIFNKFAENDPFSGGFQLSYYRARSWTTYILCVHIKQL